MFKTFHFSLLITYKIKPPKLPTRATPQKPHIFINLNYLNMTEKIIILLQEISQYYYYIKFNFKVILFLLFSFTYGRKK